MPSTIKNCHNCNKCNHFPHLAELNGKGYVLVGNMNVGKSTLFSKMKGGRKTSMNIPGSTVTMHRGIIQGTKIRIFDTPGIYSIFSNNEDECASRDIFLLPDSVADIEGIILVADAKNIKRSLAIALQYSEYGLPIILAINMMDEAASRGVEIDTIELSKTLGIRVVETVATNGMGVSELVDQLQHATPLSQQLVYPEPIEKYLSLVASLINSPQISPRAVGLLLLTGDQGIKRYLCHNFGRSLQQKLGKQAAHCLSLLPNDAEIVLGNIYNQKAAKITEKIAHITPPSKNPFILRLGDCCTKLSTGIPISIAVLALMYLFVGKFGATFLVDQINYHLFEGHIIPWIQSIVKPIPSAFVRDMIIDPDFGILPTGIFLALGLVMPVIFCFYLAFGVLEDSGYLSRVSILLDRTFQKIGLNGKGVIPLVMGFSCVTMAILTTRILNTEKEKNIASFLLFLCMPCAPLIAVMLVILDSMPLTASIFVFSIILIQILIAGSLANKILPGNRTPLILEIPAMRIPKVLPLLKMAAAKTFFFMKEALPVFIAASFVIFLFNRVGGLQLLASTCGPIINKVMGLPEESVQVFIKTVIRRESGAAELEHLRAHYTNLQLVVNLIAMTFIAPCLNAIIVLFKERGIASASIIITAVTVYATILASGINHFCHWSGFTFT